MKENIIDIETAILAESVEYNIPCWDFIDIADEESSVMDYIGDNFEEKLEHAKDLVKYWRPTQSLLQKWLRDTYNIHLTIGSIGSTKFTLMIDEITLDGTLGKNIKWSTYKTYEETLEKGLFNALKLVK